ncbi:enhancer of mRNA-decapping protein 4 [Protopterus annectens]|uniref:enhancer of mRNA-decapping protein 4 n=1 Tax=Protopterus annectens TaxID=7888 RepID=UPI001CFB227C|nr:enhancer of mRNA-decapping protein 4 [Protopterus annectens]
MATNLNIEDATQHLRDILKLDRPDNNGSANENSRKSSSYNGELNGLLVSDSLVSGHGGSLQEPSLRKVEIAALKETQTICLSGDDNSTCIEINARDVEIIASGDTSISSKARGSNKVKIQPVAKYEWEKKYYYGNLIAVSNTYVAYAIRGASGSPVVRVISLVTAERILLKGFVGGVADLAFAHLNSDQLACLDEVGNLFVWQLTMKNGKIQETVLACIKRPEGTPQSAQRRIIWCPFVPEENEDNGDDSSQTLALLHEDRAEVWYLDIVRTNHSSFPVDVTAIKEGYIIVKGHTAHISEGALSPDGSVLATASYDGFVKFWQIYLEGQDQPRCLHEWQPHGSRPLSCLIFCDNHKKQDPDVPYWRFLVTGADQNQELKMWCTVSWTCLQTVRFLPDPFTSSSDQFTQSVLPSLKVSLDLSASYLILSDVQRKVLYVMEVLQNQDQGRAYFSSISEFLLTHPVLSFGIQDVSRCRLRHTEVLSAEEETENSNTEGVQCAVESTSGVQIKLFCVHTKALQDVQIRFQPHFNVNTSASASSASPHEHFVLTDNLADVSLEGVGSDKGSTRGSQHDLRRIADLSLPADFLSISSETKPKLMTPDAFMTPSTSLQQIGTSPSSSVTTLTAVTALNSTSASDPGVSRASEDLFLSPKMSLDSSITLSSSNNIQTSPRSTSMLIPCLPDKLPSKPLQITSSSAIMPLELQPADSLVVPQASPTRERSPDVISSASTAMSQDIPEIASETLQRSFASTSSGHATEALEPAHLADSMASAASALHLLSPRSHHNTEHNHHSLDMAPTEPDRLTSSLLDTVLSQENSVSDNTASQPWPAAPDITRETRNSMTDSDHDDEVASFASTSGSFGAKGASQRLPVKDWKARVSPRASPKPKRRGKKEESDALQSPRTCDHQVGLEMQDDFMTLLRCQQREIMELKQSQLDLMQRLTDHMDSVQSSLLAHVERLLETQQEQEQRRIEHILAEGQERNGQFQDNLSQSLSQTLPNAICNRLDKTLRDEVKKIVPHCISKTLDPVTGQISNTVAAKLTAVEGTLKENVAKLVKSKNTTDAIARTAADVLQGHIQTAYREAFQTIVLPAFEKSCQTMFQQINDNFKQGTQEYIQQLESHLNSKTLQQQEARDPLVGQLQHLVDSFQSTVDQLTSTLLSSIRSDVQHQLHIVVGSLQEFILTQVQKVVKVEVGHAMKEQQAAVTSSIMQAMRSAAGTPVPSAHLDFQSQQTQILQHLQQGHINQAFQQALTASDLNLVLYVCETVDIQQVFGQNSCPLTQPVLLSLIQQLSSDLGTRTELKLSYLDDAVMNLDHGDPITRDHMGAMLNQLRLKLVQFLQVEPHHVLSKKARRLLMILQGLVTPSMS